MEKQPSYRCVANSLEGFISQLIRYISSGHYFYLTGRVPPRKDPAAVDRKLIALYDIDRPRWARARRRLGKQAGIHYLRHEQFFVIVATHGKSGFFNDHEQSFRDIRRNAMYVGGYAIRYTWSATDKRWRVFVRLDRERYRSLKARMLELALRQQYRAASALETTFSGLPWQPYEPVRLQLRSIIRAVNRRRRYAGYSKIRVSCIPKMRTIGPVFVEGVAIHTSSYQAGGSCHGERNQVRELANHVSSANTSESSAKRFQDSSA